MSDHNQGDDSKEMADYERVKKEADYYASLPEERLRSVMRETVMALYAVMSDMSEIPEFLHPADVVTRIQRGNIVKDGRW